MSKTRYDAYPYPERDPREETQRLLTGSPSSLYEIDHFVFGARRDWSQPFQVLVAGGGTGDGLIMLAQQLTDHAVPHEITYIDASRKSMQTARDRAEIRSLENITFLTGDFTQEMPDGAFDYIDCCGVLHHLPSPLSGLQKLASALTEGGGVGGMVYAPLGRTGVYPLQSAFGAMLADLPYPDQVAEARQILAFLPKSNWLRRNPFVQDHKIGDAGLFDLLLHDQDQPFWSDEVISLVTRSGLDFAGFVHAIKYDPAYYLPASKDHRTRSDALKYPARARVAEELCGSMKNHIFYAVKGKPPEDPWNNSNAILHLSGVPAAKIGDHITNGKAVSITLDDNKYARTLAREIGSLIAICDGNTTLGEALMQSGLKELNSDAREDLAFLTDIGALKASSLRAPST